MCKRQHLFVGHRFDPLCVLKNSDICFQMTSLKLFPEIWGWKELGESICHWKTRRSPTWITTQNRWFSIFIKVEGKIGLSLLTM